MRFSDIYRKPPALSFELFPPKSEASLPETFALAKRLARYSPDFITVTYGAGGTKQAFARELVTFVHRELGVTAVQHLTCGTLPIAEVDQFAAELAAAGITNILALRGDPPSGSSKFTACPGGFGCARDLTAHLSKRGGFSIAVAGYPETHREAESRGADLRYLREKVDAGAEVVITQLFFDNQLYFRFVEDARRAGISVPIVPGIMPIGNAAQLKRFTSLCGAAVPESVTASLARIEHDPAAVTQFGIDFTISQCRELLSAGVPGIHLYTLNRSIQVEPIIAALGLGNGSQRPPAAL